jgi:hypothetical protein
MCYDRIIFGVIPKFHSIVLFVHLVLTRPSTFDPGSRTPSIMLETHEQQNEDLLKEKIKLELELRRSRLLIEGERDEG